MGTIIPAALIALAFITWPIVGKHSGVAGAWVGTLASFGTLAVMASFSGRALATPPAIKAMAVLFVAGAINGIGLYFYSMKVSDPLVSTGTFIVTTSMMMTVWTPILDRALNGSVFSPQQIFGFVAAAIAIFLLSR